VSLLMQRAAQSEPGSGYTFLHDSDGAADHLSFSELHASALSIGAALSSAGPKGARVVLLHRPGLEFIRAFFGCLYAGLVPVPVAPPGSREESWVRLQGIARNAGATIGMTDLAECALAVRWVKVSERHAASSAFVPVEPDARAIAMLQYSSGSTGNPKGVMLTHASMMANQAVICEKFSHEPGATVVGWLPQYHDMGLIGNILQPLYLCGRAVLLSPASFLQRPARWLQAISTWRACTSGGPNFAFDLCTDRIRESELATLDLTHWRLAFTGSEPVHARTMERFSKRFAGCGFRREAFYPCYGLAESTLMVTGGRKGAAPTSVSVDRRQLAQGVVNACEGNDSQHLDVVDCGDSAGGHEMQIVNPQTRTRCLDGTIGEIWVRGASVALGYWGDEERTREIFGATLGDEPAHSWLRTGDLGFARAGRLFITGRRKDLIIVRGRNIYPHDIEEVVQSANSSFRRGGGAAFGIEQGGTEQLVLVQELDRKALRQTCFAEFEAQVRDIIATNFGVTLHALVLTKQGGVPKTSSGKIRRNACRDAFLSGSLVSLYRTESMAQDAICAIDAAPIEDASVAQVLRHLLAQELRVSVTEIDAARSMVAHGLDSLRAAQLAVAIQNRFGMAVDMSELLSTQTICNLADDLQSRQSVGTGNEASVAATVTQDTALSFNEVGFWRLQQLHWRSNAYSIAVPLVIDGTVDVAALSRAVEQVCQHHPILRTRYPESDGVATAMLRDGTANALSIVDASSWTELQVDASMTEFLGATVDVTQGPLLQAQFLQRSTSRSLLAVVVHHIAVDLWSLLVILRDLGEAYRVHASGKSRALQVSGPYRAFATAQSALLASPEGQAQLRFWQDKIAHAPRALEFRKLGARPVEFSFRSISRNFRLPGALAGAIREKVKAAEVTTFSFLLAAYEILLYRRTGQRCFLVGSPVSQRPAAGFDSTVGCFVDVKWIAADVIPQASFRENLSRVHADMTEVLRHRNIPLQAAMASVGYQRSNRAPFPNVRFAFQQPHILPGVEALLLGQPGTQVNVGGLALEALTPARSAQADISLTLIDNGADLLGVFSMCEDVFEIADVEAWTEQFAMLLEAIVCSEDAPIATLPLVPPAQRAQSLMRGSRRKMVPRASIHELFALQAQAAPDAFAVRMRDRSIDYRTLEARTNALAHFLIHEGVVRGDRVGLYLDRSVEVVISLLAVLKAGGCCVMLDPSVPPARRRFMAEDAHLKLLLTNRESLEWLEPLEVPIRDLRIFQFAEWPCTDPGVVVTPDDAAYIIYTSGSTGQPKGVVGLHRGVMARTEWMIEYFGTGVGDTVLHSTPMNFVRAEREIFFPLCSGATLALLEGNEMNDPVAVVAALARFDVTFTASSPSLLRMILTSAGDALRALVHLKHWFIGADVLGSDLLADLRRCRPGMRWTYFYGSTEVSSDVACYTVTPQTAAEIGNVPVGGPLDNTDLYVLDADLEPVPPGGTGVLYVGGAHLSRGYWGDPSLTAQTFRPNPYSDEPGARMYCTGDIALRRASGELVIVGRNDDQVSVLGNRVALGEVARVVRSAPGISDAAVVLRDRDSVRPFLVAYVVESQPDARQQVWRHAEDALPVYMRPAFVVPLSKIPITPLGKVDRSGLPPHDPTLHGATQYCAPHTETQRTLLTEWSALLGLPAAQIGIRHHFFESGGNSLLLSQFYARLRQILSGTRLQLSDLYRYPSIQALSNFLATEGTSGHDHAGDRAHARRRALSLVPRRERV
jgi:amino acid adenylation domain-containing protein